MNAKSCNKDSHEVALFVLFMIVAVAAGFVVVQGVSAYFAVVRLQARVDDLTDSTRHIGWDVADMKASGKFYENILDVPKVNTPPDCVTISMDTWKKISGRVVVKSGACISIK